MNPRYEYLHGVTRRHFLRQCHVGLGGIALASLLGDGAKAAGVGVDPARQPANHLPHFRPRAKQVIFLHMAGGPSQLELLDYKPELSKRDGQHCPEEFFKGQRFAFIKGHPKLLGTMYEFGRHGECGASFSCLLPYLASIADDLTIVRSMTTEQFNHAPAQLLMHTGSQLLGHASLGSWATYGLGTLNRDLPGFIVLVSGGKSPDAGKSVWGSGYLPGIYQGVQCRSAGDPILFVDNPPGMSRDVRRRSLDTLADLNRQHADEFGSADTLSRIEQYELAFRMQLSVPEVMDIRHESPETLAAYGAEPGAASFANNCLLARRLVEQGVRFVQLYDWGWDGHGTGVNDDLVHALPKKCQEIDRPVAALIRDLKLRGMLDDTLVVWGGEFGRTSMMEARDGSTYLGRDHHPKSFTMLFAGGGMKPGFTYGETDDFGYFVTKNEMTVRDLQATILHLLGLDAHKLTYNYLGLDQRIIGPAGEARVHHELIA
ncbi:MAG TPA: DUF1501 domain-containing protein [Lacipirellulaceae bacterium]|nr:DUF1501 domain-containing protein [Lacipirellulaceae bacterium]